LRSLAPVSLASVRSAGGGGVGYGSGFYGKYSSGDLTHTREFSVSREIFGADGFGLIGSFDSTFNPNCSLCMGNDQRGEWGIIVGGAGAGAYQQYTQSFPLITVSGVRNVLDRIFKRTFVYTAQNPGSNQTQGFSPFGVSASPTQQGSGSSLSTYRPASSYGLSANSEVTASSADAIANFLSQFLK
jgi:hypothetical protein